MPKEIVVHSMQELTELLKGMKETEDVCIRVDYGKEGDADATKTDRRPAVVV